jgi:hypothetical protein
VPGESRNLKAERGKEKKMGARRTAHGERIEVEKLRSSEGERGKAEKAEGEKVGRTKKTDSN